LSLFHILTTGNGWTPPAETEINLNFAVAGISALSFSNKNPNQEQGTNHKGKRKEKTQMKLVGNKIVKALKVVTEAHVKRYGRRNFSIFLFTIQPAKEREWQNISQNNSKNR